jgi:hypothetical protein
MLTSQLLVPVLLRNAPVVCIEGLTPSMGTQRRSNEIEDAQLIDFAIGKNEKCSFSTHFA